MDKKRKPAIGQLIHSFNPKPFKNMDVAIHALLHKDINPGEIAIAYYNDIDETVGVGSVIATGNLLPGGNQIFKNTNQTDKLVNIVRGIAEQNSADIKVIEENVNNNIADIAYIKGVVDNVKDGSEEVSSEMIKLKNQLAELIKTFNEEINGIGDIIDDHISDLRDEVNTNIVNNDTSVVLYVNDRLNTLYNSITDISNNINTNSSNINETITSALLLINNNIDNVSLNLNGKIDTLSDKVDTNEKTLYDIINKQSAENSSNISNSLAAAKLYTDLEVSALNKKFEDVSDNIIWTINDVSKHTMSYINDVKYNIETSVHDVARDLNQAIDDLN